jgi:enoyl-CoA hydratase/carnithine racemase
MNLFTEAQLNDFEQQHFAFLEVAVEDHVLFIILNREKRKNALHPQMVNEIAYAMNYAHRQKEVWMLVFQAKGNVFCAGADLKAMAGIVEPHESTIPKPQGEVLIGELFNQVHKPTLAKVTGDVYAGGFFFLAGCNIVLAQRGIRLALPEVKRGLFPFQVMAALLRVMPARKVLDWCIRGYDLAVEAGERFGLVTEVCEANELEERLAAILQELKQNSPTAIRMGLEAYAQIQPSAAEHKYLFDMLMKTIATKDGQEGLKAFREKRQPQWRGE